MAPGEPHHAVARPGGATLWCGCLGALLRLCFGLCCGDPSLPSGVPVMHTIHDPRKTVMNPHNRVGITEYIIHYTNKSNSVTWPLGRIQMPHRASSLSIVVETKSSIGSPCRASTVQATDRETDPSSHRRRRTPHHHHHNLLHNLTKLIARDKAVSTFWNCTCKPPKRNKLHAIWL
jgi:hypothetical protein